MQEKENYQLNKAFLKGLEEPTRNEILNGIAKHYGTSLDEAYSELTEPGAEALIDYVTGPNRNEIARKIQQFNATHQEPQSSQTPYTDNYTGITLPDGSVVIGQNKDDLWVAMDAEDLPAANWNKAMAQGDLPTIKELNLLWENRDLIPGGLEAIGIDTSGSWYWSSTEITGYHAWFQRFSDGNQSRNFKDCHGRARCARRFSDSEIQAMLNQDAAVSVSQESCGGDFLVKVHEVSHQSDKGEQKFYQVAVRDSHGVADYTTNWMTLVDGILHDAGAAVDYRAEHEGELIPTSPAVSIPIPEEGLMQTVDTRHDHHHKAQSIILEKLSSIFEQRVDLPFLSEVHDANDILEGKEMAITRNWLNKLIQSGSYHIGDIDALGLELNRMHQDIRDLPYQPYHPTEYAKSALALLNDNDYADYHSDPYVVAVTESDISVRDIAQACRTGQTTHDQFMGLNNDQVQEVAGIALAFRMETEASKLVQDRARYMDALINDIKQQNHAVKQEL